MEELIRQLAQAGVPYLQEEPLSKHTSFRIGGPAELMAFPRTQQELAACLREPGGPVARLVVKHEFLADVSVKVALSSYHRGRIADPAAVRGLAGHYFVRFMAVNSGAGLLEIPLISKRDNISQY